MKHRSFGVKDKSFYYSGARRRGSTQRSAGAGGGIPLLINGEKYGRE